jgi:adenylate kinase
MKCLMKRLDLDAVFYVSAPDEKIIKRIAGRRVCETCGAVYHVKVKNPRQKAFVIIDGGKLIHRYDDMEETVKNRLEIYKSATEPIIGYYEKSKTSVVPYRWIRHHRKTYQSIHKSIG